MYYVIQVAPREERQVEIFIQKMLPDNVCQQCFYLKRHILKKYHGEWHDVHEKLLPGYVFIKTDNVEYVYGILQKLDRFTKILGHEDDNIFALSKNEIVWLECLLKYCENDSREIPLSYIRVNDESTINIISGPLKAVEPLICKVNLHKRVAEIIVEIGGKKIKLYLGIKIMT